MNIQCRSRIKTLSAIGTAALMIMIILGSLMGFIDEDTSRRLEPIYKIVASSLQNTTTEGLYRI